MILRWTKLPIYVHPRGKHAQKKSIWKLKKSTDDIISNPTGTVPQTRFQFAIRNSNTITQNHSLEKKRAITDKKDSNLRKAVSREKDNARGFEKKT